MTASVAKSAETADVRTIHERMVAILAELPPIGKDQKNVQQNFMFRGHDDVLNAINPLLAKHGVFALPHVLARETSQRTTAKGSAMFEVSLLVEYQFFGAAGDYVRASSWGEGTDMGDKATSKAMTMAFKSVLNQAFAISNKETADPDALTAEHSVQVASRVATEEKTVGGTAAAPPQAAPPKAKPSTAEAEFDLLLLVEARGGDVEATRTSMETARAEGKLGTWLPKAKAHWEKQSAPFKAPDSVGKAA